MATETKRDDAPSGEMARIDARIEGITVEIAEVKGEIEDVKRALNEDGAYLGITEPAELLTEKRALEKQLGQLREKDTELQRQKTALLAPQQPAAPGPVRFIVQATIRGAQKKTGVRAYIYQQAMQHLAYYRRNDKQEAIWYVGGDLHVRLSFTSMERAASFQTCMANMRTSQIAGLTGSVDVNPSVSTEPYAVGARVWDYDYDPTSSESPGATLADMKDKSDTSVSVSVVEAGTPLFQHQSLEKLSFADGYPFERAHIKDKAACKEEGDESAAKDENNLLALSPTVHKYFDGKANSSPAIAIRPGTAVDHTFFVNGKKRQRVEVFVECRTQAIAETMHHFVKDGTTVEGDIFKSWVDVEDPVKFSEYLAWKYANTKAKWP